MTSKHLGTFELFPDVVRVRLADIANAVPSCRIQERNVGAYKDFVQFELCGPTGTAGMFLVIHPGAQSVEFSVGPYLSYEPDYEDDYPEHAKTLDFVCDLVESVLQGKIEETRYFLIHPRLNHVARVVATVRLSRHPPIVFRRWYGFLSILATRRHQYTYIPYQ